ncbi:PAS domain S-box protein [Deinococcus misasensis]|uniref:PAS domain S-box protein n=1 Tax=Deinococcus misasensis TaxID=392413 RepID=UPI00068E2E8A|nr:PAS domain S-box protein [Deinococcus misasensis]
MTSPALKATQLALEWPQNALHLFAELFGEALHCTHAGVGLQDSPEDPNRMRPMSHWGLSPEEAAVLMQVRIDVNTSVLMQRTLQTPEVQLVWTADPSEWGPVEAFLMEHYQLKQLFCCALKFPDRSVGVFYAASPEVFTPDTTSIVLAAQVAQSLTLGLHQQRLREQNEKVQQRMNRILDHSLDLIVTSRGEVITSVNLRCWDCFGYRPEEMVGKSMDAFLHPEDVQITSEALERLQHTQTLVMFENRQLHKDGRIVHLEWNAVLEPDGECIAIGRDITSKKSHQQEMELLSTAVQQAHDLIYIADNRYEWPGPYIQYVNDAFVQRLGYEREDILGKPTTTLHGPLTDVQELQQMRQRVMSQQQPQKGEAVVYGKNRQPLWCEYSVIPIVKSGVLQNVVIILRDVSEKHIAFKALQEKEAQLQLITQNTVNMIVVLDAQFNCTYVSPSMQQLYGYPPEESDRINLNMVHPEDRQRMNQAVQDAIAQHQDMLVTEHRGLHKDGHVIWVESAFKFLWNPQGECQGMIITALDITARIEAQQEKARALQHTLNLLLLVVELEQKNELTDVVEVALKHSLKCMPFDFAAFFELEKQGSLKSPVVQGNLTEAGCQGLQNHLKALLQQPHFWEVIAKGTAIDCLAESRFQPCTAECTVRESRHLVVPIVLEGRLYGLMLLGHTQQEIPIGHDVLRLLSAIRDRITHALERTFHLEQLDHSREETLRTLGLALEFRDYETKGHTDRVVDLSLKLGQQLDLPREALNALRWGAYLHDAGKIAISDQILLKPAKLTPEEYNAIKKHSQIGHELLKHIPNLPSETLALVLHHHERWDGKGYPSGLAGQDIPLLARVFTVVDVYDALVSKRPYKEPFTHEAALQEIQSCSGSMFDPAVVAAFEQLDFQREPSAVPASD